MKVFTYSEARQNLSQVLFLAQTEEVEIRRKDGTVFSLRSKESTSDSPFDIPGIKTKATTQNILDAIRDSRYSAGGNQGPSDQGGSSESDPLKGSH